MYTEKEIIMFQKSTVYELLRLIEKIQIKHIQWRR